MSIENFDFKNYLKKLEFEGIDKFCSNEELQNCLLTVSNYEDEENLSRSDNKSRQESRREIQSVSSSETEELRKLNLNNLKIKNLLKGGYLAK